MRITPAEYAATADKIQKINARAAKRGFTGRFDLKGERVVVNTVDALGFEVREVFYEVEITGEAPSYGGWTFLARVDALGDTFTLATAPGVEHVDRSLVHPGECDHCGHNRDRRNTYLVRNAEGEVKNVGSTCIKDFLGWDGSIVWIDTEATEREIEGGFGGGERMFTTDTVLAYAHAATRAFGWVASSAYQGVPTAQWVRIALGIYRPTKEEERMLPRLREFAAEATEKVAEIREYVLSDDFNGGSTYVDNLKATLSVDAITYKQIGLVASAPQALIRATEQRVAKEAEAAAKPSEYFGKEKERLEVEVEIKAIRYIEGDYGTTTLYTFVTSEGNLAKWFASTTLQKPGVREYSSYDYDKREYFTEQVETLVDAEEGDKFRLKATVKGHEEWQGTKSTILTRCKAL